MLTDYTSTSYYCRFLLIIRYCRLRRLWRKYSTGAIRQSKLNHLVTDLNFMKQCVKLEESRLKTKNLLQSWLSLHGIGKFSTFLTNIYKFITFLVNLFKWKIESFLLISLNKLWKAFTFRKGTRSFHVLHLKEK